MAYGKKAALFAASVLLTLLVYSVPAFSCGGVTATIADDPKPFGVRTGDGPGGVTLPGDH